MIQNAKNIIFMWVVLNKKKYVMLSRSQTGYYTNYVFLNYVYVSVVATNYLK